MRLQQQDEDEGIDTPQPIEYPQECLCKLSPDAGGIVEDCHVHNKHPIHYRGSLRLPRYAVPCNCGDLHFCYPGQHARAQRG